MLHALIIDDEENGVISLELILRKYVPEVKLVAKTTSALEGVEFINSYRPDIVFLDINMPNLNGFELLEKIEYRKFHLIFTTAHEEYALKAIKQNALDYLLKPIDGDDLKKAIEKVKNNDKAGDSITKALDFLHGLRDKDELKISVPGKNGIEIVQANDVMYIEASSNHSVVVLKNGEKHQVNKSLKDYENQICLEGTKFIRIHNSFIINVNHVTRYLPEDGGYAVVGGEKTVPISKIKKDEFLKMINFGMR